MIEPLSALVLNSLLSTRGHCSSVQSAGRAIVSSKRSNVTPNFFTPAPRRFKGKGKAVDALASECDECAEWAAEARDERCCAGKHSLWCSKNLILVMMKEIIPTRHRSFRRPPLHLTRAMGHPPPLYGLPANTHASQRRHSSHTSNLSTKSRSSGGDFLSQLHVPAAEFDAEAAWGAFVALPHHAQPTLEDSVFFAEQVADSAERLFDSSELLEQLPVWGDRLRSLLVRLSLLITPLSALDYRQRCLNVRVLAMAGDTETATAHAHTLQSALVDYKDERHVLEAYGTLLKSIWRNHSAPDVLDLIITEWQFLGSHMLRRSAKAHFKAVGRQSHLLRQTAHLILESIAEPAILLVERQNWTPEHKLQAGQLLLELLCVRDLPEDALTVLQEMERQSVAVPISLKLTVARALARARAFPQANNLFHSLVRKSGRTHASMQFKYYQSTGLYIFAHQGDVVRAEEYWNTLLVNEWVSDADVAMLLQAYAVNGNIEEVVRLFDEFFSTPESDGGDRGLPTYTPTFVHYTIVIFAHAQRSDFDGMNVWLERMSRAGMKPDATVYTIILKSFAMRGEVNALAAVLDQMRSAGMEPGVIPYTVAISLLAQRRDPVAAEALFKRAIQEGVVPDRRMVISLMNAHVEAASWQGVIRAFDYIKSSPLRRVRLSIDVYNTLLKAYVLIGAPFQLVSDIFGRLEETNVRPDARTFALLIQSACDAGQMDVAYDIYQEMDRLSKHSESNLQVNAYILTILMSGYLRLGNKVQAKAVYDEMRERNIQPTSTTFGAILKAYANEKTEESLQTAEAFLKSLMEAEKTHWVKPTGGRSSALEHVYRPLMDLYARAESPEEVERLFQGMIDAGGEPTLGTLTALLFAYSRRGNLDAVQQLWPQILTLGIRNSNIGPLFSGHEPKSPNEETEVEPLRQASLLCVPLSIYMDALSAAGKHMEIAAVWQEVKSHGFTFDSHNWNHLAVALVRAGEPARAFEVLEKVILPYQQQSEDAQTGRDKKPDTPFSFDVSPGTGLDDSTPQPAFEGPGRTGTRRAVAVMVAKQKAKFGLAAALRDGEEDDFAHPLHILHQISPSWSIWRPHAVVLGLLSRVLGRLERGQLVEPVKAPTNRPFSLPDDEEQSYETRRAQADLAADLYAQIYADFPSAVRAVRKFERYSAEDQERSRRHRS
ncbi:hypothetical protein FIBSPDRAFT_827282 [Athelia psychrophila]|uniref:Pentacotripeptide-repeat region of PRORP domain-containing protein n=1 Tax=Athelia psychrophila TaxID=1759441 RepID=A0A166IU50_9AGAM|nr:hypothetical protein FIBSPDRAFT_827282 [Fibularhizoctonia sp. CBS 109695]